MWGTNIPARIPWSFKTPLYEIAWQSIQCAYYQHSSKRRGKKRVLLVHFCGDEVLQTRTGVTAKDSQTGNKARSMKHRFNCLHLVNCTVCFWKCCCSSFTGSELLTGLSDRASISWYVIRSPPPHCHTMILRGVHMVFTCLLAAYRPWVKIPTLSWTQSHLCEVVILCGWSTVNATHPQLAWTMVRVQ